MTTRRGAPRPRVSVGRPRLTWRSFQFEAAAITLVGGTNAIVNLGADGPATSLAGLGIHGDYTIRRTRYELTVIGDSVETEEAAVNLWCACIVVSADAFASGSGALPAPQTDNADWYQYNILQYPPNPDDVSRVTDAMRSISVDSKAMRKINENSQVPAMVLQVQTGFSCLVTMAGRMLVSQGRQ